jgi:hypothetical protein
LIQIADPDTSSNPAKEEYDMSEIIASQYATANSVECVLSASSSYVETFSLQSIDAQPGLVELVIRTQLLSAKNPEQKRVKSRTCIDQAQLSAIRSAIDQFLLNADEPFSTGP